MRLDAMNDERATLQQATKDLLVLIGLVQERESKLRSIINEQLQILHNGVQRAGQDVNRVVDGALPRLTQLSKQALDSSLGPAIERFSQNIHHANEALGQATGRYSAAQQALETRAVRRMHMATVALGVAAVIALGSGGWLLYNAKTEASRLRQEIHYLDLVNRADLAPCGDGRLCARVDEKGERFGPDKKYRQVAQRQ
jgi:hypothetical protein